MRIAFGRTSFLTLVLVGSLSLASGVQPAPRGADDGESALHENMEVLEEGLKALRRSIRDDEQRAQSLALLDSVQAATVACKAEVPPMAADVPEGERAQFLSDYRLEMCKLLDGLTQLEIAVLKGETDEAKAIFKRVREMEDSGHDKFSAE